MPYLYNVVLGVTGAEGSSEEEVEPLRSPSSPKELVVLLRVHVDLPRGIAPGILWDEEHPAQPGGSAGPAQPEEPTAVTSDSTMGCGFLLLCTLWLVHPPHPRGGGSLFGCLTLPSSSPQAELCWLSPCRETFGAEHGQTCEICDPAITVCRKDLYKLRCDCGKGHGRRKAYRDT